MATPPLINNTPLFLNTGGGVFGAVRRKVNEIQNFVNVFGDRIYPGAAPKGTGFPYVVLNHVSCVLDDYLYAASASGPLPLDIWKEVIQISTYADNYESARQLSRWIHARISRHTLMIDCWPCFVYPDSRVILKDPERSERSGDIWHADCRYHYWVGEWVYTDDFLPLPGTPWYGSTTTAVEPTTPVG